jgi:predicted PurR-regulated permease PerM
VTAEGGDVKVTDGADLHLDPDDLKRLSNVFSAPRWLRDLGLAAWFLVAVFALLVGLVWVLGETQTIIGPVLVGAIVAIVASPIVSWLKRHRVPRAAGAAIVLLGLVVIAVLILLVVLSGIVDQSEQLAKYASAASDRAQSWLQSAGVDQSGAASTNKDVSSAVPQIISTLVHGILQGIRGITSLAFAASFAALSIFFLLKDGPAMRVWTEEHLWLPLPVARTITGGLIRAMRGYFKGVTIVAAFNGIVVGLGALALGVPLAGTIAVVTFLTAYIPYVGAFIAGAFAVIVALGAKGTTTALIMLVIVILANGLLQNVMQPFAMGSALQLNPLVVLVLTISAGCLFGMVGLVLAAPIASAAVHIAAELRAARAPARGP